MAAAHVSPRKRRSAILATGLAELDGALVLAIDCLTAGCAGERHVLIRDVAGVYGRAQTVAEALRRMRCAGCGRPVGAAWLMPGPGTIGRAKAAKLALVGAEAQRQ